MLKGDDEIEQSIQDSLSDLQNGEITGSEAIVNILRDAEGVPDDVGDVSMLINDFGEEHTATVARALTSLTDKGVEPDEVAELLSALAYTQVQPTNEKYLDDAEEAEKAVDIGRRVLKREKKGGRPSKVDSAMEKVEKYLKWHTGEQQKTFLKREIQRAKQTMSRPTWNKFQNRADERLEEEISTNTQELLRE